MTHDILKHATSTKQDNATQRHEAACSVLTGNWRVVELRKYTTVLGNDETIGTERVNFRE
jgi:hypothetical protein